MFFVRGKGIKTNRGIGDLYIEVVVEIPTRITKEQKKILEELENSTDIKQCSRMKQYKDNLETMYGQNPYGKKD